MQMTNKKKLKPLPPSQREKKRYLAFEIISDGRFSFAEASRAIWDGMLSFLGITGTAAAGIWLLADKYDEDRGQGILRLNHAHMDEARGALSLITAIRNEPVIVRSLGASGVLKKAVERYIS